MDSKRKNKLLKVAIGRLQVELDKFNIKPPEVDKGETFLTDLMNEV